jgi:hydroxyacylglutathione hydrolase
MAAREILTDLFFIERGYLNANHFVYRAKAPILIDTGYIADFHQTQKLIADLGVTLSNVHQIISTHCHCDHIGGNRRIQEQSGCGIALHKVGKHFIDTRDDWSTWWRYYHQEADFFNCTQALEDGQPIAIGPHEFEIIHTPGHAADGIVLYNAKAKILISSDTLWEKDLAVITVRVEGSKALFEVLESLEKLAALDVQWVYPGHGAPFCDMRGAIALSISRINRYLTDRERLGEDLLKRIFIYTLLMKKGAPEAAFFSDLMNTHWYKETVAFYFHGEYESMYSKIMDGLIQRGIVQRAEGMLKTTVKP